MSKKCKWLMFPLIMLLCMLQLFPLSAAVTGSGFKVTAGNLAGTPGSTIKLTLVVSGAENANTMGVKFTYDESQLEMTEASKWLCSGETLSSVDAGKKSAVWTCDTPTDLNGTIFEAVFKVKDDAAFAVGSIVSAVTLKRGNVTVAEQEVRSIVRIVSGVTISGGYECFGREDDEITIELLKDGVVTETRKLTGNKGTYSFVGVEISDAAYTLRATKPMHCPREYAIAMTGADVVQEVGIQLYGDVTRDGIVDAIDATQIARYENGKSSVLAGLTGEGREYSLLVADVSADGIVDAIDSTQIARYENGKSSVFGKMK